MFPISWASQLRGAAAAAQVTHENNISSSLNLCGTDGGGIISDIELPSWQFSRRQRQTTCRTAPLICWEIFSLAAGFCHLPILPSSVFECSAGLWCYDFSVTCNTTTMSSIRWPHSCYGNTPNHLLWFRVKTTWAAWIYQFWTFTLFSQISASFYKKYVCFSPFVPPLIAQQQLQYVISGAHDDVSTSFSFPFVLQVVNMAKYGQILPINH